MSTYKHGLIVAGSRELDAGEYHYVKHGIESYRRMRGKVDVIVHGACSGADAFGKHWAGAHDVPHEAHPADWGKHGKAAGPIRNGEMVALPYVRGLVVVRFPDSKGSHDIFTRATGKGLFTLDIVVPR